MNGNNSQVIIFYDGICPACQRYRRFYEKITYKRDKQIVWFDITNQQKYLQAKGIDPLKAMQELHLQLPDGEIISELDAYLFLMRRIYWLKPLAWFLDLGWVRPLFSRYYRFSVDRRLRKTGRLSMDE